MTTHITAHYKWICSIPLNLWKQQHWQNISSSSAVLHGPKPLLLPTSPTQPSWFARSMPWTVSHTQGRHTQLPCLHIHTYQRWEPVCAPVWSLSILSCLITVIYFSLCHKLSVIWMLFSKVLHFITYFFLPLLWYSIMLLNFSYENTTKHPSGDHIKLLALLHRTKHLFPSIFSNNQTKILNFTSVMISITIWCATHCT